MNTLGRLAVVIAASVGAQLLVRPLRRRVGQVIAGPAPPGPQPGQTVLAIPAGYWALCVGAAVVAVVMLVATIAFHRMPMPLIGPVAFVMSGGGAVYTFRDLRMRIVLDDEGLLARGTWRRTVRLRWADITTVTFVQMMAWIALRDREGNTLRIPILVRGLGTLTEQLRTHVAETIWRQAVDDYSRTLRRSV
jgi:Bacterial PH domain